MSEKEKLFYERAFSYNPKHGEKTNHPSEKDQIIENIIKAGVDIPRVDNEEVVGIDWRIMIQSKAEKAIASPKKTNQKFKRDSDLEKEHMEFVTSAYTVQPRVQKPIMQ